MVADFGQVIKLAKALIVIDPTTSKNPVFWREFESVLIDEQLRLGMEKKLKFNDVANLAFICANLPSDD